MKDEFIVVNTLSKIASAIMFIFGLYIHFHGDIRPGGGFQSGVIFAAIFILLQMIDIIKKSNRKLFFFNLNAISFCGFFLYFFGGFLPIFFKKNFFGFSFINFSPLNVILINIFEIGICLGVFSAFYRIFTTFFSCLKDENII